MLDVLKRKKPFFFGSVIGLALGAVVALAVTLIISNILVLGPSNLTVEKVKLTTLLNLPASMKIGEEIAASFEIANEGSEVSGTALKARVKTDGVPLPDPSIVKFVAEDPDTGAEQEVTLSSVNGNLEGTLKSGWLIPVGYERHAHLFLTFNGKAPRAAYSVELWVEKEEVGPGPTPTPGPGTRTFVMDAYTAGNIGVSGTNADGTSIAGVTNPTLIVKAGETVTITINWKNSRHNMAVYTASCPDGFCDPNLVPGGRSADVTSTNLTASITITAPAAGTTLYWYCDYHTSTQVGTIVVIP